MALSFSLSLLYFPESWHTRIKPGFGIKFSCSLMVMVHFMRSIVFRCTWGPCVKSIWFLCIQGRLGRFRFSVAERLSTIVIKIILLLAEVTPVDAIGAFWRCIYGLFRVLAASVSGVSCGSRNVAVVPVLVCTWRTLHSRPAGSWSLLQWCFRPKKINLCFELYFVSSNVCCFYSGAGKKIN